MILWLLQIQILAGINTIDEVMTSCIASCDITMSVHIIYSYSISMHHMTSCDECAHTATAFT